MSISVQSFLAAATRKAAQDLTEGFLALPEERRNWKAGGRARSPADMIAECALNNGYLADIIVNYTYAASPDEYYKTKEELASGEWEKLSCHLFTTTESAADAIANATDQRLSEEQEFPWGSSSLTEVAAYPYWNMSYHLGQINLIGMLLENCEHDD